MAAPKARTGTLTANVVAEVTVAVSPFGENNEFGIVNLSGQGIIWVRTDGVDPTIGGDNCFPVLGYRIFTVPDGSKEVTPKMISDTALQYTVEGTDGN